MNVIVIDEEKENKSKEGKRGKNPSAPLDLREIPHGHSENGNKRLLAKPNKTKNKVSNKNLY